MSAFSVNFHADPKRDYEVRHKDYPKSDSRTGDSYTSCTIESGGNYITLYLPFGHRLSITAPVTQEQEVAA